MVQRRRRLRFLDEPPPPLRIGRHFSRQNLDGDKAIQPRVLRLIDIAHAAGTQFLQQLILKDSCADHVL